MREVCSSIAGLRSMVGVATVLFALLWVTQPAAAQVGSADLCTAEQTHAGKGTLDDPYLIKTACQLQGMHSSPSAHYELANNIDASTSRDWNKGAGFYPVGLGTESGFSGSLVNSSNYVITELTINRPGTDNVGLFSGLATEATVRGVILLGGHTTGRDRVGSLVGDGQGMILDSYATGSVSGQFGVGGLAGFNSVGNIENSYATGSVSGQFGVGGLAGFNSVGNIENSSATGNVSGQFGVGGLVGFFNSGGNTENSYATGSVSGESAAGGLVGYISAGNIENSSATGSVSGQFGVGGLVGYAEPGLTISNSYATGSASGGNFIGGLAGSIASNSTVSNSSATGSVTGTGNNVGGLVGNIASTGTISNSYATGDVSGTGNNVGGLAGSVVGASISNSYATGNVSGTGNNVGGLAGNIASNSTVSNSYVTGSVTGAGNNVGGLAGSVDSNSTVRNSYFARGPGNEWGEQRSFSQLRCPTTASAPCQGDSVSYEGWDTQVWNFGGDTELPQLLSNRNPDLNLRPYIAGRGERLVRAGVLPRTTNLVFEVDHTGSPGESATSTWTLTGMPAENGFVYFDLGDDSTSTTASGSTAKLLVVLSMSLAEGAFFDVVLMNSVSANGDRVRVRVIPAPYVQNRLVEESENSTVLTFTAITEPGNGENLQWAFLVDGEATTEVEGVAQFVAPATGSSVQVSLNRPGGKADFGNFVLWVSDPAGTSARVTVNIVPICVGGGQDLMTRQGGRTGTAADPYQIWTLCQLQDMSSSPNAHYELATNIDARPARTWNDGAGFEPIAIDTNDGFSGSFVSSSSHVITGLTINRFGTNSVGLFSRLAAGATIRGVILLDARVTGNSNVGSLAGFSAGSIGNSSVAGDVSGDGVVGGLVGGSAGNIDDSYATGSVSGTGYDVGGLAGHIESGSISNSYATGSVVGDTYVGGLVGYSAGDIDDSYATGSVVGESFAGGLAGSVASDSTVSNSYFARRPDNGWGEQRSFSQLRCPTTASATCQGDSVSYEDWDTQVWDFGDDSELPQLKGNRNPDLNLKPYIAGQGGQTVRLGPLQRMKNLVFEVDYTGPPEESVTLTWSLSGMPAGNGLVYFDLGNGKTSTTAGGSTAKLVVMRSLNPDERTFFNVVLTNGVSAKDDRVQVRVVEATPPVIDGGGAVQNRLVKESEDTTSLTFTAVTDPGNEENLQWVFLVDGEATTKVEGVAQFVGSATGTRVTVRLARPGGKADFGSFVLRVSDPAGTSAMVAVNVVPECAGDGQDLDTRQVGAGTSAVPYQIWTLCQLQDMSSSLRAHYELATNIDARPTGTWNDGTGFEPIASGTSFSGSFMNSSNHEITELTINRPNADNVGLFSRLAEGATIRGVILMDTRVTGYNNVGSLVGSGQGMILGSSMAGTVSGNSNAGGLAGYNEGSISNSYATGSATGNSNVGGLAGDNEGSISNSYATGSATGNSNVGGLAGDNTRGSISNSYATGPVSATGDRVGGLVGDNTRGSISNSYATGSATGNSNVGGLVGDNTIGSIGNSYATGSVSATGDRVGGLVGRVVEGSISNSYFARGPENGSGEQRGFLQMRCPTTASATCQGDSVSYKNWDTQVWNFGGDTDLPQLLNNHNPDLNLRPYIAGQGERLVRARVLPGTTDLAFEVDYPGPPGESVTLTWMLSGVPAENGLVYFDLGNGKTSTTASGSTAKLLVMLSMRLPEGAFFDVVLMNDVSVNGDRVRVRVISAAYVQNRPVKESVDSTIVTVTAPDDIVSGHREALQWEFLVDGEAMTSVGEIARFVDSATGASIRVRLTRPGGKADFGSFVLRVSDPAGASAVVAVNIISECAGGGQDLDTRQDGAGTSDVPYLIWTLCQLQDMSSSPGAHYELAANIDARPARDWNSGAGFEPVASGTNGGFSGSFVNSSTHVITGLAIDRPTADNVGLFSSLAAEAAIRGVALLDARVTGSTNVGSLVGSASGVIEGGSATGSVSGSANVGGLVGYSRSNISVSFATGSVSGDENVGGLVGYNEGSISNSYATGSVTGNSNVGGLAGSSTGGATISNSYSVSMITMETVTGHDSFGGLVGAGNSTASIVTSYYTGPKSDFGEQRSRAQLQCPEAPDATCPKEEPATTYVGWDEGIWDFVSSNDFPILRTVDQQEKLRIRVYLGGAAR